MIFINKNVIVFLYFTDLDFNFVDVVGHRRIMIPGSGQKLPDFLLQPRIYGDCVCIQFCCDILLFFFKYN